MNFKSLNKKTAPNGEKLRLTEPSVLFNNIEPDSYIEHIVKKDEVGRPDLIAQKYFNEDLSDHLLKINGISNPFSIAEGERLIIPGNLGNDTLKWIRISSNSESDNQVRNQFLKTKKTSQIDQRRINFLQQKNAQKNRQVNQELPPNILEDGESNVNTSNLNSIF